MDLSRNTPATPALLYYFLLLSSSALLISRKKRRLRRFKVQPFNKIGRLNGHYQNLIRYAKLNDQEQYAKYTRMSSVMFNHLLELLKPHLQKEKSKNPISPGERLSMTLHYLAEGCSMQQVASDFYVGKTTAYKIIIETCRVLWDILFPAYIPAPSREGFIEISKGFFKQWNMPNCVGALDGKHIQIRAPRQSGNDFLNSKKINSIILMATCDAFNRFVLADVVSSGSNDSHVFSTSAFGSAILHKRRELLDIPENKCLPGTNTDLSYFFVADQAFPLNENIMRPYPCAPGEKLSNKKNIFNNRLSRAHRTIENTFGIFASRWGIFRKPIIADLNNCEAITRAAIVLHNYLQTREIEIPLEQRKYCPVGLADVIDNNGHIVDGQWRQEYPTLKSVRRIGSNFSSHLARSSRDILADYFVSDVGGVEWQYSASMRGS